MWLEKDSNLHCREPYSTPSHLLASSSEVTYLRIYHVAGTFVLLSE